MKSPIATLLILAAATMAIGCGMLMFAPRFEPQPEIPKELRSDIYTPETVKYRPLKKDVYYLFLYTVPGVQSSQIKCGEYETASDARMAASVIKTLRYPDADYEIAKNITRYIGMEPVYETSFR
jgi:hypothetical protein